MDERIYMEEPILENAMDLEKVFIQYNSFIYRYIYIRVSFQKEIAEDLAQDVFVKAWKNRASYDPAKSTVKNWLFVIAKRLLIDHYRNGRKEHVHVDEIDFAGGGFEDEVLNNIIFKQIIEKMSELKVHEKDVLTLRYIEGLDIKEIAQYIKKSETAAKVAIHRALQKLKGLIHENN